jgi:predicted HTH transcriptional regulator
MSERDATSNATGPRQTTKSGKTPRGDTTRKDMTKMGMTKKDRTRKDTTPTAEQRELLRWVASLGAVTAPALACRLDIGLSCANARLSAARRRGLLSRDARRCSR